MLHVVDAAIGEFHMSGLGRRVEELASQPISIAGAADFCHPGPRRTSPDGQLVGHRRLALYAMACDVRSAVNGKKTNTGMNRRSFLTASAMAAPLAASTLAYSLDAGAPAAPAISAKARRRGTCFSSAAMTLVRESGVLGTQWRRRQTSIACRNSVCDSSGTIANTRYARRRVLR